jgi:hypothetical protein
VKTVIAFILSFSFLSSAFSMELLFVSNTRKLGDGKPFILLFDGVAEISPAVVGKAIACYNTFSPENKTALLRLFDVSITELRENHATMLADPEQDGFLTVDTKEPHQAFVDGPFKECMSRN